MTEGPTPRPNLLTVMVFKENFSARTFKIPFRWITRLGALLGIICALAGVSTFFTVKYFLTYKKGDPSQFQNLEQEYHALKSKLTEIQGNEPSAEVLSSRTLVMPSSEERDQIARREAEADKAAAAAHPLPLPVHEKVFSGLTNLFSPPSPETQLDSPDPRKLPFQLNALKMDWQANTLNVRFVLQYTKTDGGHQQGRVLMFARGPGLLMAYPPESLHPANSAHLISPTEGEIFSVSRFREVKASFGPLSAPNGLNELEVLIFEKGGHHLLTYQRLAIPQEKK